MQTKCSGESLLESVAFKLQPIYTNKVIFYTQAFNAEKTIKDALDSIKNQTHENFSHYVLDNGSADNTGGIIDEYVKQDPRFIKLVNKTNNIRAFWDYVPFILSRHDDNCWLAVLDADDTYHPTFAEKMLRFALENNLDIVSCGYDTVNAQTGNVIIRRALDRNLVISGAGFTGDFIRYRRYMCGVWCKLYSFGLLKKGVLDAANKYARLIQCADTAFTTKSFQFANRAGVLGESLHSYNISENSVSFTFAPSRIEADQALFRYTKEYLLKFGEVSKINEDYLFAIYLGLISDTLQVIYRSDLGLREKLIYISDIFKCEITKEMLQREADPSFRNLSERSEFLQSVIIWIKNQAGWKHELSIIKKIALDMGLSL
jgi:glycosyltransferase involved in cell wall biosynthesis